MRTTIEMAREAGDDEWKILIKHVMKHFPSEFHCFAELVRADERARMAEQPAQQEPVATLFGSLPVYDTSPPAQRNPLTDDELADLWFKQSLDWMEFARAIEAAHGIKENT